MAGKQVSQSPRGTRVGGSLVTSGDRSCAWGGEPGDSEASPAASRPVQGAQALGVWDRRGRVARLRPKCGEPELTRAGVKPAPEAASGAAPPRPLHAMLPLAHGGDRVKTLSSCSPWPSRAAAWAARPATPTLFLPGAFVPKPQNTPPGRWGGPITPELCP